MHGVEDQKLMSALLFSCEYATCAIPEAYRELFHGAEDVVTSPEGWDSGALNLAQGFAMKFRTPLVHGLHTRLLLDLDKNGDERWSRFALKMPEATRQKLADREEIAYRGLLKQRITEDLRRYPSSTHLMLRTTPEHEGRVILESFAKGGFGEAIAAAWRTLLLREGLDVSHAREVGGSALAGVLCGAFPEDRYSLLRLKVSQSFFLEGRPIRWDLLKKKLGETLITALAEALPPVVVASGN
jgi:hypothetical protein